MRWVETLDIEPGAKTTALISRARGVVDASEVVKGASTSSKSNPKPYKSAKKRVAPGGTVGTAGKVGEEEAPASSHAAVTAAKVPVSSKIHTKKVPKTVAAPKRTGVIR